MLLPEAVAGLALHVPPGSAPQSMQPLVYGYIRLNPADLQEVGDCLMRDLAAYAEREGFTLGDVFTDRDVGISDQFGLSGFAVMVETLRRPGVDGVLIPSLCHFSRFPHVHQAMRALIELETGARVFVMNHPWEERHDDKPVPKSVQPIEIMNYPGVLQGVMDGPRNLDSESEDGAP